MKKRILALVLSVAMVLSFVPFSAFADGEDYSAGAGASYLLDMSKVETLDSDVQTTTDTEKLTATEIDGEKFIVYSEPQPIDKETGLKGKGNFVSTIDATKITYGTAGIPDSITLNESANDQYIALRIKIDDYRPAYYNDTNARVSIIGVKNDGTTVDLTGEKTTHSLRWLDLEDGSMIYYHPESGYQNGSGTWGIDFTGDMDGWLLLPFKSSAATIFTIDDFKANFKGIKLSFSNRDTELSSTGSILHKATSWDNIDFYLGDVLLVNDAAAFAAAKSVKYNSINKYAPHVEDTAYYASRIGGVRGYYYGHVGDIAAHNLANPDSFGKHGNYSIAHLVNLPNGDRAIEIKLNPDKGTTGKVVLSTIDAYENKEATNNKAIAPLGVPDSIPLNDTDYFAFRIATTGGSETDTVAFSLNPGVRRAYDSKPGYTVTWALSAGEYTYIDANTGAVKTLTAATNSISHTGNLDGYILIPFSAYTGGNGKADYPATMNADVIRRLWGGGNNFSRQGLQYNLISGFENGRCIYFGDLFFVSDPAAFETYHTNCAKVGHNYVQTAKTDATCTEAGSVTYVCQRTDCEEKTKVVEIPALDHDWFVAAGQEPTCTTDGYEESACSRECGVEPKVETIPATGKHTEAETATPAGDDANHNYLCTVCDKILRTESCTYVEDEAQKVEPQIGVAGKKVFVCSVCGDEKEEEIPALEAPKCEHTEYTIINATDAKCGEAGYSGDKKCDACGEVFEMGGPTAALEHDQDTVIKGKDATCTEAGLTDGAKCSKCGLIQVEQKEIPAAGHDQKTVIKGKDATCTEAGLTDGAKCSKCGLIQVEQKEIPATGHTKFGEDGWVGVKEVCGNECGTVLYDLEALLKTGEATLEYNVSVDKAIVIDYETTLNLNGKTMALSGLDTSGDGIFWVKKGGVLTINGEGELNSAGNNSGYKMALWADGGKIIINGGTYTNDFDTTDPQYDLIYVKNGGEITINGGEFICATPKWTLNSHNDAKGTFFINGGQYYEYDPSNIDTDEGFTSWVAPSVYDVVKDGSYYTLTAHTCKYEAKETVAPTATESGYTFYECKCGVGYKADYTMPLDSEVKNVEAEQITETMDLKVTWDAIDGADMYLVYVYDAEGTQVRGATVTNGNNTARINGFKVGTYTVKVRARVGGKYTAKYDGVEVTFGSILPDAPKATVVATTKNSITVEWDAVEGAEAYFVEIVGGDQRFAPCTTDTTITWNGLKANTEYKVSICVRLGATVYVGYGEQVTAKTKDYEDITITAEKTAEGILVAWDVDNADMQWVKRVDAEGNVTQIAVTAETSIIAKDVEGANTFYVISRVTDEYGIYRYVTSEVAVAQ